MRSRNGSAIVLPKATRFMDAVVRRQQRCQQMGISLTGVSGKNKIIHKTRIRVSVMGVAVALWKRWDDRRSKKQVKPCKFFS
jgi:hypothetical protein